MATFKALAEVFGVLYELFVTLKMPRTAVLSTVWKSTLGIKGKDRPAQKKAAQAWVEKTYGVKPTQDECDAICIGAHYVNNKVEVFDWLNSMSKAKSVNGHNLLIPLSFFLTSIEKFERGMISYGSSFSRVGNRNSVWSN